MAKQKMSRKELLKPTDEFLSLTERIVIYAREHSRYLGYACVGLAALVAVYIGYNAYMDRVERKAQNVYNQAYEAAAKVLVPKAEEGARKQSEELFQKVMDDYGLAKVSRLVPPELAYLKFEDKKYDESASLYKRFLENSAIDNSPYQSLAWLALAACFEEKRDYPKAIEYLNNIQSSSGDQFKDLAMLNLARVYRLSGQEEKAQGVLKEFVAKFSDSPFLSVAKAYIGPQG